MAWKTFSLAVVLALCSTAAYPCSARRSPSALELVKEAEAIVIVGTEGLAAEPGITGYAGSSRTQVRFRVVQVLKGTIPAATIEFNGSLDDHDDRNDQPVPYDFVRPGGRHGNCFALNYRRGAQYLLLLKRSSDRGYVQPDVLTPYWAPLAPTNEQVFGASDPWVAWVRKAVAGMRSVVRMEKRAG